MGFVKLIKADLSNNEKNKTVWVVKQTQPSEGYNHSVVKVFSTEEKANEYARQLNKEYGSGCIFSKDYDFEEVDYGNIEPDSEIHYYDVDSFEMDEQ